LVKVTLAASWLVIGRAPNSDLIKDKALRELFYRNKPLKSIGLLVIKLVKLLLKI